MMRPRRPAVATVLMVVGALLVLDSVLSVVWREPAMGHAEVATTAELIERIGAWVRAAYEQASRFCDDDPRE